MELEEKAFGEPPKLKLDRFFERPINILRSFGVGRPFLRSSTDLLSG